MKKIKHKNFLTFNITYYTGQFIISSIISMFKSIVTQIYLVPKSMPIDKVVASTYRCKHVIVGMLPIDILVEEW